MRAQTIAVALLVATLSACGSPESATPQLKTVRVADHTFTVPQRPTRVVTLWQPSLAALTALDVPVVGTVGEPDTTDHGLSPYLPQGGTNRDLTIVSNSAAVDDINIEKIAALKPDLIIGTTTGNGKQSAVTSKLRSIAPVALLDWTSSSDWRTHFDQLAQLLADKTAADRVVQHFEQAVRATRRHIRAGTTASVTRLQKPGEFRIESPQSFSGQVLAALGFTRPRAQRSPDPGRDYRAISDERLADADAQYLFALPNRSHHASITQLTSNPLFKGLLATRSGHAYEADQAYWDGSNYYSAERVLDDVKRAVDGKSTPLS